MSDAADRVRITLLEELSPAEAARHLVELEQADILPEQVGFSMRPTAVLEKSRQDPTRRTFVITLLTGDDPPRAVGVGVLQLGAGPSEIWPAAEPYVVLRGFSIDAGVQGRGVGSAAVAQAVRLAGRLFPEVCSLVLTVHVDNHAGIRVYERNGFVRTGAEVMGRAGREYVMVRPASHRPPRRWRPADADRQV